MALKLYNTLTRQKDTFQPIDPKNVRMYVCGPTVYDFAHIGNARPVIVFDVLFRLLRHIYGESAVTYVRNITDVDDKINARALRDFPDFPLNDAIARVTEKTANQFHADVKALGCLAPTHEPRATDNIPQMIKLIQSLLDRGNAYVAQGEEGREALFDVMRMPDYGLLSRRNLGELEAGARVGVKDHKRNPGDFVLWKESNQQEPGWDAQFTITEANREELKLNSTVLGIRGRPGWHIECSAMSARYLGEVFDIHGGGLDLIFPHHENEIAQSRCAHGTPVMANVWMHNGFLQVEGEKMSKSLGNFRIIFEEEELWPGEVLRFAMLRTHYRQPIDWTLASLNACQVELEDWVLKITDVFGEHIGYSEARVPVSPEIIEILSDDINTPEALAYLRQNAKRVGKESEKLLSLLCDCEFIGVLNRRKLGLLTREFGGEGSTPEFMVQAFEPYQYYRARIQNDIDGARSEFESKMSGLGAKVQYLRHGGIQLHQVDAGTSKIEYLINARLAARKAKDFKRSDEIRDELAKMGIALKDTKNKDTGEIETTWEVMR